MVYRSQSDLLALGIQPIGNNQGNRERLLLRRVPAGAGHGRHIDSNQSTTVVDFSGATFYNTSRDEMNAWAAVDFLPATADANPYHRVATGALAMIKSP